MARLARLELSEEEIELYLRDLNGFLASGRKLQQVDVGGLAGTSHALTVGTVLRPDQVGKAFPGCCAGGGARGNGRLLQGSAHCGGAGMRRLAQLLAAGEITSTELVRRCLERIKETEPELNAFITVDEEGPSAGRPV